MTRALVANVSQQQVGLEELKQLMRSVTETTERLEATHAALRRQVALLQDELSEANARLRRSRTLAALGEMAAGIAHEVRNPLASIQLYAQMLGEDVADRPEATALCEKIARAVDGLDAIVRDVLRFAQHTMIAPQETTAAELLRRALEACGPAIEAAGVRVVGPEPAEDQALAADPGLIVQALGNLIRNAVQSMDETANGRRTLRLSIARSPRRLPGGGREDRVVIGVGDTGPGFGPQVLRRMFNPFFTTRKSGTGLGLAIVHRIVDAHGGHVSVANVAEGGAVVELCLPPVPLPAAAQTENPP